MEKLALDINPIGIVHCDEIPESELRFGQEARIEIFDHYIPALKRMEEHDYFWVLCWFHKANRELLETYSWHLKETDDVPYGIFSLRSPCRPNPVSLTLVKLKKAEGNFLYVDGLDVFNRTYVLDIKPYTKGESVFSPRAPYIRPQKKEHISKMLYKKALQHHREECAYLKLAVRMAIVAEAYFGDLTDDALTVHIEGSACLADTIQGITGARLSNPPRFTYTLKERQNVCTWRKNGKEMVTECNMNNLLLFEVKQIDDMDLEQLLSVKV